MVFKQKKTLQAGTWAILQRTVFLIAIDAGLWKPAVRAMDQLLLLGNRLLLVLEASVGAGREFVLKLLDPTGGVDELQLACVKRVANIANVDLHFLAGAPRDEAVAAATGNLGFEILGVDSVFHDSFSTSFWGRDEGHSTKKFRWRFGASTPLQWHVQDV